MMRYQVDGQCVDCIFGLGAIGCRCLKAGSSSRTHDIDVGTNDSYGQTKPQSGMGSHAEICTMKTVLITGGTPGIGLVSGQVF